MAVLPIPSLLIVDDDPDICGLLAQAFQNAGVTATTAADGEEASALVDEQRFDAIITDIRMPRMSGIQFAANAKSGKLNANTPVFMLSGHAGEEALRHAIDLGVVSMLPKPFNLPAIVKAVTARIGRQTIRTNLDPAITDCFISAAADLTISYLGKSPVVGKVLVRQEPLPSAFITGLITFSGPGIGGFLALSFSKRLMLRINEALFQELNADLSESMSADIAGEMANQAAGRAKANLARHGMSLALGMPQAVLGLGHKIYHKTSGSTSRVEFTVDDDIYALDFNLQHEG